MAALLGSQPWLTLCGEADGAAKARRLCEEKRPGAVLLDLDMPGALGLVRDIRRLHPGARILAFSEREETIWMLQAFGAGASGFVSKHDELSEFTEGLRQIAWGGRFVSRRMSVVMQRHLMTKEGNPPARSLAPLTPREMDIFRLLGQGLSLEEIADALHLSKKTIETHVARSREKLSLRTGEELKRLATEWTREGQAARQH